LRAHPRDGTINLWNATSGVLRTTLAGHQGWVNYCAWSPDGKSIVSAGNDGMRLWRAADGKALRAFYHLSAKFSQQAQYLSLANTNLDSDNPEVNWEVVDYSDEAWRYVFYQGQDAQGRLRRWPWEPV
jgi:WD40 repeat protein